LGLKPCIFLRETYYFNVYIIRLMFNVANVVKLISQHTHCDEGTTCAEQLLLEAEVETFKNGVIFEFILLYRERGNNSY